MHFESLAQTKERLFMSQQVVDPKVMTRSMALVSPTKTYKSV